MNSLLTLVVLTSTSLASPTAETVRVAICQMRVEDGKISENLARAESLVRKAKDAGARICVFPEMMDVGFGPIVKSRSQTRLAAPIPGKITDRLGEIAVKYDVWIVTALLEEVPGGAYDTGVMIDNRGCVVAKHRKGFCYPSFAGTPCFPGNHQEPWLVDSPWGPVGVVTCADLRQVSNRRMIAREGPSLVFVSFANPQADIVPLCNTLAAECRCPVAGANMLLAEGPELSGGKSRFVSSDGALIWEGGQAEVVETRDLKINVPDNRPPWVNAGEVQTIRLPRNRVALRGQVLDDGRPRGMVKTHWSKKSGPGRVDFARVDAVETAASFSTPGTYLLRLTADDGSSSRSADTSVTVLAADGSDPDLIGYWTFDGSSRDESGYQNHAALRGRATYADDAAPIGRANPHSLDLRSGAFALVAHSSSLDAPAAATIALWVKFRSAPPMWPAPDAPWVNLLAKGKWWEENYTLGVGAYLALFGRGFGDMLCPALENDVRNSGQWHHVAAVSDANRQEGRIYIDGALNQRAGGATAMTTNGEPLYLGRFSHESATLDGLIDEVQLYRRALSDEEVAAFVPKARLNRPPVVDAGPDRVVSLTARTELAGDYRDDRAFASSLTAGWTAWRKVSGPGDVLVSDRFSLHTTASFTKAGKYLLELRASDGAHTVFDTVSVSVSVSVRETATP